MYKFAEVIHDAQLQTHGITHIEKSLLDDILSQIGNRKSNRMILFIVPFSISGRLITDSQKVGAVKSIMKIFAGKANIVALWNAESSTHDGYEYCNLSTVNFTNKRIADSHTFAVRFKDCHYDRLDKDSGRADPGWVESLLSGKTSH